MENSPIALEGLQAPDYLSELHTAVYSSKVQLRRMNAYGMRFYYRIDQQGQVHFYGSITSVKSQVTGKPKPIIDKMVEMGKANFERYLNQRAHRGTFFHIQAAELTIQGLYDTNKVGARIAEYAAEHGLEPEDTYGWHDEIIKGLQSWLLTMQEYEITPIAVEIPVFSDHHKVAGTIDLVCEMNAAKYTAKTPPEKRKRVKAIIDWKTGYIFPDHAFQLELGKLCWAECLPDGPQIERVYNWSWNDWRKNPTYELKNQSDSIWSDPKLMQAYLDIYQATGKLKPRNIRTFTGLLERTTDLTAINKTLTPEEYILAHEPK